ncbi:MAG: OmpA family protein [Paracoccaceae bacterium]
MTMRRTTSKIAIISVVSLGLGACGDTTGQFYREAGVNIDEGGFGNPTLTNHLINTGEISYAQTLSRRFEDEVPAMVNFEFNKATLDDQARSILMAQADWIKQFPEVRFRVYGHTDLVGSDAYNRTLGQRRASAVVAFLTKQGIDRSRLEALVSYGETQPLVVTEGRERRNRRTVTEVSGFVEGNPMVMNGKYAAIVFREYLNTAKSDATIRTESVVQ